jgi:RNA recognition motif-containing protein
MNIYVGNMHFSLTNDDVFNLFTQFGAVVSAKIINDKETGRSKGFGFVEMENDEAGRAAISALNESEVMGRKLIVNEARPQEPRSSFGGGGGGGFKKRDFGGGGGGGFRGGNSGGSGGGYRGGGNSGGGSFNKGKSDRFNEF